MLNQLARRAMFTKRAKSPNRGLEEATLVGVVALSDNSIAIKTKNALELLGHIGRRPITMSLDFMSSGNYISIRLYALHGGSRWRRTPYGQELQIADGSMVKTNGRV